MGPGSHREHGEDRREPHEAPSPVVHVPSLHTMLLPSGEQDQPGPDWPATHSVRSRHTTPPQHSSALHATTRGGNERIPRQHHSEPYLYQPRCEQRLDDHHHAEHSDHRRRRQRQPAGQQPSFPLEARKDMPSRHHHETKGHEDPSEPHTERDNQEEPESHPVQG